MTKEQILLVKRSWRLFSRIDPTLIGRVFYEKLFAEAPSLKRLFKADVNEQSKKLVDMLTGILSHVDGDDSIAKQVAALAQRHRRYGAKPEHYKIVGSALLWTLQQGFGDEWNAETEEAWQACYNRIASAMLKMP